MLFLLLGVPGVAGEGLDAWRRELGATDQLAENDVPRAYVGAQRLAAAPPEGATPEDQARAWTLLGGIEDLLGQVADAQRHAEQARGLARPAVDPAAGAAADILLSVCFTVNGRYADSREAADRSVAVLEKLPESELLCRALVRKARIELHLGRTAESAETSLRLREIAQRLGQPRALAWARLSVGLALAQSQRHVEARAEFAQAREHARAAGSRRIEAEVIGQLAACAGRLGDRPAAEKLFRESLALNQAIGAAFGTTLARQNLAYNLRNQGRYEEALPLLDEVILFHEMRRYELGLCHALSTRSWTYLSMDRPRAALADAERAYELAQRMGRAQYLEDSARRLAEAAGANGDYRRAFELALVAAEAQARAQREQVDLRVVELERHHASERKEREIAELALRNRRQADEIERRDQRQRSLRLALVGSLAVVALLAYLIARLSQKQRALGRALAERQAAEAALRLREAMFRTLVENSPDPICRYDRECRRLYANAALGRMIGRPVHELLGGSPDDARILASEEGRKLTAAIRRVIAEGEDGEVDLNFTSPEGEQRVYHMLLVPESGADGRVATVLARARNITVMRGAEQRMAHFVANLPGFVFTFRMAPDGGMSFPFASSGIEQLYGLRPDEVQGEMTRLHAMAHPDDAAGLIDAIAESARTMTFFQREFRIRPRGRPERWIEARSVPERDAEGGILWHGIMQDITGRKRLEQAVNEQTNFQSTLLNALNEVGLQLMVIENGRIIHVGNRGLARDFGFTDAEIDAQPSLLEIIHPDDRARVMEHYRRRLAGEPVETSYEMGLLTRRGERREYETAVAVVPGTDPVRIVTIGRDITVRKRMKEELAAREQEFRSLANNVPDNIARWDVEGRYLYTNPVHERTLASSLADVIGKRIHEAFPDGGFAPVEAAIAQVVATGRAVLFVRQPVPAEGGELRIHDVNLVPERDADGKLVSVLGIGRDMTEVYRLQEAIAARERELRDLAESSPGMMGRFHLRPDGTVCMPYVSPNVLDLFGVRPEDLVSDATPLLALNHPDDARRVADSIAASARSMTLWHQEYRIVHPQRGVRWMQGHSMPKPHPDGGVVWSGYVHDITERKRMEEALSESRERLASIFRTVPDGIMLLDHEGRIVECNASVDRILGTEPGCFLSCPAKPSLRTIREDGSAMPDEEYPVAITFRSGEARHDVVIGVFRPDGTLRWISASAYPIRDAENRLLGVVGGFCDITAQRQAQAALRESEERFRQAFEHAGIGMSLVAANGRWLQVNRSLCEMLGYTEEEMQAATFEDITHPDDIAPGRELNRQLVAGAIPCLRMEKRYRHRDGHIVWVRLTVTLVRSAQGEILQRVAQIEDITARRLAEEEVRQSRERYAALVNTVGGIVWEVDVATLRFTFVSPQAERLLGYPVERWLDEPTFWQEHIHPEDRTWAVEFCLAETREKRDHDFKYRMLAADGRVVWLHDVVAIVIENDQPAKLRGIMMDITESQRTDEALRESEERFRQAFEYSGMGIALVALDGRWLRVNRAVCAMLGWSEAELKETTFEALTHPDDLPINLTEARRLQNGEIPFMQVEKRYRHREGHYVWGHLTVTIVRSGEGAPLYYVSQLEDITGRRRLEHELISTRDAALKAARIKSEFLANMSHEIRTPMNGVIGMADALAATKLDVGQREMVRIVLQSGESLLTIIDDILDLSKIESGKMQIEKVGLNPRQLVTDTVALFAPRARAKGLELRCELAPELDAEVTGDPVRLRQVLSNLLGNALKFTAGGSVVVRSFVPQGAAQDLHFEVKDTGIGIAAEAKGKLFSPFVQADGSHTRVFGGTGLGLAISRQLVELMGGRIGFVSEAGQGSTFWFQLPFARVEPSATPAVAVAGPLPVGPAGALRLLVAEDNEINRLVLRQLLDQAGCAVDFAENGRVALEMLAAPTAYDAVLMDCQMPELDGFQATRRIRGGLVPGRNPRIPIIALTAYAMAADRERCLAAGMDDHLAKPIRLPQLQQALVRRGLRLPAAGPAPTEETGLHGRLAEMAQIKLPDGRTLAEACVTIFRQEAPRRLAELTERADQTRGRELAEVAHAFAGSVANLGAVTLRAAVQQLETAARSSDWPGATKALAEVKIECERLLAILP